MGYTTPEYSRAYFLSHREQCKKNAAAYREKNREKIRMKDRERRLNNPDYYRQKRKEWKKKNSEKVKAQRRRYNQKHKKQIREYEKRMMSSKQERGRLNLSNQYIKKVIMQNSIDQKIRIKWEQITPRMIMIKRRQLEGTRIIKQFKLT